MPRGCSGCLDIVHPLHQPGLHQQLHFTAYEQLPFNAVLSVGSGCFVVVGAALRDL